MAASKLIGKRPEKLGPRVQVVRVDSTSPTMFAILSKFAWGTPFHWWGNRSHVCTQETHQECENCKNGWPQKWRAYLHCERIGGSLVEECIVELTQTALALLESQVMSRPNFRGTLVQISKTKGGAKGRFVISVLERMIPEIELKAENDPQPVLEMLWGWNKKDRTKIAS